MSAPDLVVVILTLNEERNLAQALDSVVGWADRVIVLDSGSTDRTVSIARAAGCAVISRPFEGYAAQRNYALRHLSMGRKWLLFLDADEWIPRALREEIGATLAANPPVAGFYLCRRLIWMGTWIKRGYYPVWLLRLVRPDRARCEGRLVNEHLIVDGTTTYLRNDFIHEDRKSITDWVAKHNHYAGLEALSLLRPEHDGVAVSLFAGQAARLRWMRRHIWRHIPLVARSVCYFLYRYLLRGGFLDGKAGLSYHVLQGLWFPMLIDLKLLELHASNQGDRAAQPTQLVLER